MENTTPKQRIKNIILAVLGLIVGALVTLGIIPQEVGEQLTALLAEAGELVVVAITTILSIVTVVMSIFKTPKLDD